MALILLPGRSHTNEELVVPKANLEMFKHSIEAYHGPRIWNGLPISVRRARNIEIFKNMVQPIFKENSLFVLIKSLMF